MSSLQPAEPHAASPAFGQADLTNCERELIHLAGSVQPHGALLLLRDGDLVVLQASANCQQVLGMATSALLGRPVTVLGGDLRARLAVALDGAGSGTVALQATVGPPTRPRRVEGLLHRPPGGGWVLELEEFDAAGPHAPAAGDAAAALAPRLTAAIQRFAAAHNLHTLAEAVVDEMRALTGFDRVMVYRFDPDGHGKIIAEARDPVLESLLGHHYPATDIPQRARELYLSNRLRLLVDVHYEPQPLQPPLRPDSGEPLDMSHCTLRSMSPLHLQYLKNMGVTATLVASLVREGRLWGLVAAHHYQPLRLRMPLRAAAGLLAEMASTRIAAIENYAHAQVAILVRRLEQRLVEATATEGDWKQALLRNAGALLRPLEASGAALFHGGEILSTGDVPSTPGLRALCQWVDQQPQESPFACSSIGQAEPALAKLSATACGVLAVKLSTSRPDYLMWFRREQLHSITWAGDPAKPMVDNDPLTLSPRRSFQTWTEIVRGTAVPWSPSERVMARAIGIALVDIIVQVHAVQLLIAEHQLTQIRETLGSSREPVLLADADGCLLFANDAFHALRAGTKPAGVPVRGTPVHSLFNDADAVQRHLATLALQPWRGEWSLRGADGGLPVRVRTEAVPGRDGDLIGFIVTLDDLRDVRRTAAARDHLDAALQGAARAAAPHADEVVAAILANTRLAALDIVDAAGTPTVAPQLDELALAAERAAALYAQIRGGAPD